MKTKLTLQGNSLVFITPYERDLVAELKTKIPYTDRKWDGDKKAWIVTPAHGSLLAEMAHHYFGDVLMVPQGNGGKPQTETKILDVRYVGATKSREDGTLTAFGYTNNTWGVIFPESVLRSWFMAGDSRPGEAGTLYQVLGISKETMPDEIKRAYRRLALQWHPDRCKDPDAPEQFRTITHAFEILSDPTKRAKYNAGLALMATIQRETTTYDPSKGYRAPLRCGYIMAEGVTQLGRFVVSAIFGWEDITDSKGRVLVVSWPMGAKIPEERWV